MLNNLTNFLNIIKGKMTKKVPADSDLIVLGTKNPNFGGGYAPSAIKYSDLKANIGGGPVVDEEGNLIIANSSENTVIVGDGESHLIPNFSGMLIVNDHWDGRVETWICGGSGTLLLGYTSSGAGECHSTMSLSGGGYEWTNVDNLGSNGSGITFTVIKTRSGS